VAASPYAAYRLFQARQAKRRRAKLIKRTLYKPVNKYPAFSIISLYQLRNE
jgi:hypothetical protein